ncbi:WS/DGAT domain-containing protein [Aldersonia sp. NBC_00410]|uniref:wax ester/triacylglycerol synthase domain-containing protein n=1 Tax=Aldersonia sp. NBC_00410 TaxID=2975954 RepID=UPI002250E234|nr:wax ester/triacylglycerol synthase domain-containing protein [Aldersonia sp. NBC_00410]MCX5045959.1 WS/DGAT domain-containing protein [Aldersonia sp. NBC_00410]
MTDNRTNIARQPADRPLDWATSKVMSPADAIMWRADDDRRFRAPVFGVELYDCVPDWDRLVAAIDWASRMLPRMRERVVDSPLGIGVPTWAVDADFDLHYHVRRAAVPGEGTWSDLLRAVEAIAMTPLDRARPPWEAYLFEGLPDGMAAFVVKVHHAVADGLSAMLGMNLLRSTTREHQPGKPQPLPARPEHPGPAEVIGNQITSSMHRVPTVLGALRDGARSITDPIGSLRRAIDFGLSARRVSGIASPPGSPLLAHRSLSWRLSTYDVRFVDLRAASKVANASFNDAYLAGLIGAMRLYHEKLGHPIDVMPFALPISLRTEGDAAGGNKITVGRVAAPLSIVDPVERMHNIGAQVRLARTEPAAGLLEAVGPVLAWLPSELLGFAGKTTSVNDVQASNVPGLRHDTYMAGAKVQRSYPFGPLPGCAVMATMLTHGSTGCLGINHDAAAITEPELFFDCVVDGFGEVLALVPDAEPMFQRV